MTSDFGREYCTMVVKKQDTKSDKGPSLYYVRVFWGLFELPTLELVSKELNHLAAILHVYAGGLNFMK